MAETQDLVDWLLVLILIVICVGVPLYFSDRFAKKGRTKSKPKIAEIKTAQLKATSPPTKKASSPAVSKAATKKD